MDRLTKKKTDRFRFLHRLYEITDGNTHSNVSMWSIGEDLGLDKEETGLVYKWLSGERLIEASALGGQIVITHQGVVEVERSLTEPEIPTHYFPPVINILHVGSMVGSQIQQGSHGSTQSHSVHLTDTAAIIALMEELKSKAPGLNLDPSDSNDFEADIQTVVAQSKSSKPKLSIMRESLVSLRNILEGAAANAVGTELLPKVIAVLSSIGT